MRHGLEFEELWLPITGCEYHEVSSFGRVRRTTQYKARNHRTMLPGLLYIFSNNCGYLQVMLPGKRKCFVHRLLAFAFVENSRPGVAKEVNHLDRNKRNNKSTNLQWCTRSENQKHAYDTSLRASECSEETKKKISAANKGRKYSSEAKAKISAAQLGKTRGPYKTRNKQAMDMAPAALAALQLVTKENK